MIGTYGHELGWAILGSLAAVPLATIVFSVLLRWLGYYGVARGFDVLAPTAANWIPPVVMIATGRHPPVPEGVSPWALAVSPPFFWDCYLSHLMETGAGAIDMAACVIAIFVFWASLTLTIILLIWEKAGPQCRAARELIAKIKSAAAESLGQYVDVILNLPRCPSLWKAPAIAWLATVIMGMYLPATHVFLWQNMPWLIVLIWGVFGATLALAVLRWAR